MPKNGEPGYILSSSSSLTSILGQLSREQPIENVVVSLFTRLLVCDTGLFQQI